MSCFARFFYYGIAMIYFSCAASSADLPLSTYLQMSGMINHGVILQASLMNNAIAPGDQTMLMLKLRNMSEDNRYFISDNIYTDYIIVVRDEKGNVLEKKAIPLTASSAVVGKALLSHNTEISAIFPITVAFNIQKPGMYYITAIKDIYSSVDDKNPFIVVSNTVLLWVSTTLSKELMVSHMIQYIHGNHGLQLMLAISNISKSNNSLVLYDNNSNLILVVQNNQGVIIQPSKKDTSINQQSPTNRILTPGEMVLLNIDILDRYSFVDNNIYYITVRFQQPGEELFTKTIAVDYQGNKIQTNEK